MARPKPPQIEVGDHVLVGDNGRIHWKVISITDYNYNLESGLTGKRYVFDRSTKLTLHTKGEK